MHCCHSILECYNLFSGVKLSIRSFCFTFMNDLLEKRLRVTNITLILEDQIKLMVS